MTQAIAATLMMDGAPNYHFMKQKARVKEIPFFFLDRTRGLSKLTPRIGLEALWMVWWLRIADALGRI